MNADLKQQGQPQASDMNARIVRRVIQVLVMIAFQGVVLFASSGRLDWIWAWVFLGLYLVGAVVNGAFMLRYSPETIAQRADAEEMKDWDKVVGGLFALMYFVGTLLVAGLDERLGWPGEIAPTVSGIASAAFALGFAFIVWSMAANAHFSTVVRVQGEKGHTVCTEGPYRFVRHPGYLGGIVHALVAPLILGSTWALIPGGLAALLLVVRTALEDRTLHQELSGYAEYAQQTRCRLLPGVW
jgi:protein-S-isoprenylcysteine O-methyltransferase Ste14